MNLAPAFTFDSPHRSTARSAATIRMIHPASGQIASPLYPANG